MKSLNEFMLEYKKQMENGLIQKAYYGLMEYIINLKTHFKTKYPDYFVSGSIYQGYMDMTYFSFIPESLKSKKLRVGIVFIHDKVRFEVWLAGFNKQIQTKYWEMFRDSGWKKYHLVPSTKVVDSILDRIIHNSHRINLKGESMRKVKISLYNSDTLELFQMMK